MRDSPIRNYAASNITTEGGLYYRIIRLSRATKIFSKLKFHPLMLICPPRLLVIRAAATTSATMITATTVAFSNSAPAAKSNIIKERVRDLPVPRSTIALMSRRGKGIRFYLEPKAPLQMPAYNKGSTLRPRPEARPEGQCDPGWVWE